MGAANLMAKLQYGMSPVETEEDVSPIAEAYICHVSGAEFWGDPAWEHGDHEHLFADEDGNEYTEKCDGDEMPTEYYYGQYAESAAKFVNEVVANLVRSKATAVAAGRGDSSELKLVKIPIVYTTNWSSSITYKLKDDKVLSYSMPIEYKFTVEAAYSFDHDKDFYQIQYTQFIPMSKAFKGHFSFKRKMAYRDKYGGFNFGGHSVEVELCNYKPGVSAYSVEGVLPENKPLEGTVAKCDGWSVGSNVSGGDGLVVGLSGEYSSSTTITVPYKEIPVEYKRKRLDLLSWEYTVPDHMYYYKNRGGNGGYVRGPKICEQDMSLQQGWGWIVSNTKRQGDTPLKMKVKTSTTVKSGACKSGAGGITAWNILSIMPKEHEVNLPVPERVRNSYHIVAEPMTDEAERLRQLLIQNCSKFQYVIEHPERCGITDAALEDKMEREWRSVYDQISSRGKIPNVKEEVRFYLEDASGNKLDVYRTTGQGIIIRTDGLVLVCH